MPKVVIFVVKKVSGLSQDPALHVDSVTGQVIKLTPTGHVSSAESSSKAEPAFISKCFREVQSWSTIPVLYGLKAGERIELDGYAYIELRYTNGRFFLEFLSEQTDIKCTPFEADARMIEWVQEG